MRSLKFKITVFLIAFVVALIMGRLGWNFGIQKGEIAASGATTKWKRLASPSEEVARFLHAHFDRVWIESVSGKIYQYKYGDSNTWKQIPQILDEDKWGMDFLKISGLCKNEIGLVVQKPPGKIIEVQV